MTPEEIAAKEVADRQAAENATIKQMRERIDALNAEKAAEADARKAAELKLQELDRAKLEENERLKLEVADRDKRIAELTPAQEKVRALESKAEASYLAALAAIPEDKRATAEALSRTGSWTDRLDALNAARALIGEKVPVVAGQAGMYTGSEKQVQNSGVKPTEFDPKNPYANAFK